MPILRFKGQDFSSAADETVLDTLLRHAQPVSHSCRAGACGACMLRAIAGQVPAKAQLGMKETWKQQGYFYSCSCVPEADLELTLPGAETEVEAHIIAKRALSSSVTQVMLQTDVSFSYRAGQYLTLVLREPGGTELARSYSLASLPGDGNLELHVRRIPGGQMSNWLCDQARPGDTVILRGPAGECCYAPGHEQEPLLLAGTGTGLAPLYGIVRDAIGSGHQGAIHLFHGALEAAGLYLVETLRALAQANPAFVYTPVVLRADGTEGLAVGALDQVIAAQFPKLGGYRGFACGDPTLVQTLKKKWFLAGMASRNIHADAFLPSAPP